jgi:hypothetical protein
VDNGINVLIQTLIRQFSDELPVVVVRYMDGAVRIDGFQGGRGSGSRTATMLHGLLGEVGVVDVDRMRGLLCVWSDGGRESVRTRRSYRRTLPQCLTVLRGKEPRISYTMHPSRDQECRKSTRWYGKRSRLSKEKELAIRTLSALYSHHSCSSHSST